MLQYRRVIFAPVHLQQLMQSVATFGEIIHFTLGPHSCRR